MFNWANLYDCSFRKTVTMQRGFYPASLTEMTMVVLFEVVTLNTKLKSNLSSVHDLVKGLTNSSLERFLRVFTEMMACVTLVNLHEKT